MIKLIFHGGVNDVGGNKILAKDKSKFSFDFGKSFIFLASAASTCRYRRREVLSESMCPSVTNLKSIHQYGV